MGAAVSTVALLATLIVPVTAADSRLEPVVLGGVAASLVAALGILGARRLLVVLAGAAAVAGAVALPLAGGLRLPGAELAIVLAIAGLGVVVLNGWGGQAFLAPLAITGLSAQATGWMVAGRGQPAIVGVALAMALALALGLLLGAVCGARGQAAVAVITLGLAAVLHAAILPAPGGAGSLLAGDPGPAPPGYYALLAVLAVSAVAVSWMRRGRLRLALVAARGSGPAAAARGVDVGAARRVAWVTAALLAGIAGCALALAQGGVAPGMPAPVDSVRLVGLVMVLGGGRAVAALLAGAICGLPAAPEGAAATLSLHEPAWLDLVVGTTVVVWLVGGELWRRNHKTLLGWIGPAAAALLRSVTPSRKLGTRFGAMSGDAD